MPYIDIVFDREVEDYSADDRPALALVFFEPPFEALAKELNVPSLTEFYSADPDQLDDLFDDDFMDADELARLKEKHGPEEFFDPKQALESVSAIRGHLASTQVHLVDQNSFDNLNQRLTVELAEVERSLGKASQSGARFYFVIDPG